MERHMELSRKTTILFSPALHDRLTRLAGLRGLSLGELVRRACEERYGLVSVEERLAAVRELASLSLPVDGLEGMRWIEGGLEGSGGRFSDRGGQRGPGSESRPPGPEGRRTRRSEGRVSSSGGVLP